MKDTNAIERDKVILEVEVADLTANADFFFNGQPIVPSERIEVKNLGGGKHQLIFNSVELTDQGEIKCKSGKLKSTCQLNVSKGETRPEINLEGPVEGPTGKPLVIDVPYSGTFSFYYPHEFIGSCLQLEMLYRFQFVECVRVRCRPNWSRMAKP